MQLILRANQIILRAQARNTAANTMDLLYCYISLQSYVLLIVKWQS